MDPPLLIAVVSGLVRELPLLLEAKPPLGWNVRTASVTGAFLLLFWKALTSGSCFESALRALIGEASLSVFPVRITFAASTHRHGVFVIYIKGQWYN